MKKFTLFATAALTACAQPADEQAAEDLVDPVEQVDLSGETDLPDPEVIPANFRGRWSFTDATCEEEVSESYLSIGEDSLSFFESQGSVRDITRPSANEIIVDLAMKGEGEQWNEQQTLRLERDGSELNRIVAGLEAPTRYWRCENEENTAPE